MANCLSFTMRFIVANTPPTNLNRINRPALRRIRQTYAGKLGIQDSLPGSFPNTYPLQHSIPIFAERPRVVRVRTDVACHAVEEFDFPVGVGDGDKPPAMENSRCGLLGETDEAERCNAFPNFRDILEFVPQPFILQVWDNRFGQSDVTVAQRLD